MFFSVFLKVLFSDFANSADAEKVAKAQMPNGSFSEGVRMAKAQIQKGWLFEMVHVRGGGTK